MNHNLTTFLGAVPQSMFSPFLGQLYSSDDADEKHCLLLRAYESEPYLLAKLVSLANSVIYGMPNKYFYTPAECLGRVGQAEGTALAISFYLKAGVQGWMRDDERSTAVWQEAIFAAQVSQMLVSHGCGQVRDGKPFLSTLLSYLGELFLTGPVFDQIGEQLNLAMYSNANEGEIDAYAVTMALLQKMGLPSPVKSTILSVEELHRGQVSTTGGYRPTSDTALLTAARGIAQSFYPQGVFVARIDEHMVDVAIDALALDDGDLDVIKTKVGVLRAKLPAYLT